MKYKLIQTGDYLVVVNNEEVQINDIVLEEHIDGTYGIYQIDNINDIDKHTQQKIIAHLPLTKSSMIKGIDILPDLPKNNKEYKNKKGSIPTTELEDSIFKQGFIDGAMSKYVEKQKLEFAISLLLRLRAAPVSEIDNKVFELEEQLYKL